MQKKHKTIILIEIIIIAALAVSGGVYLTFFYHPECNSYACWQKYMTSCTKKASFINEEPEASWGYTISGLADDRCAITVKLLQVKQGELGMDKIVGEEMSCSYLKGTSAYAEKDLSKCHGLLKEGLQQIIINKLHSYILENLGKFGESLKSI